MSRELWTTYSVKDHLRPRELAIDVMLFDRLVFPVPQVGKIPDGDNPIEIGPVEWSRNEFEWARWRANKWDPDRQSQILDLLEPVLRKVPWSSKGKMDEDYRAEAAKLAADDVPDYAFTATRTLLTRDLPAYVDSVPAIGPAYRTFAEFEREASYKLTTGRRPIPGHALAMVLASEFIVPKIDDGELTEETLLKETVAFVAGDGEFRKRRRAFIDRQQEFLRDGQTDPESIFRSVEKMRELLHATNQATKKLTIRKVARYAFRLAPTIMGLAAALAGAGPGFAAALAAGGTFFSASGIMVDERLFKAAEQPQNLSVAFVHDARRQFGWENGHRAFFRKFQKSQGSCSPHFI
jgi:hypothetical protein